MELGDFEWNFCTVKKCESLRGTDELHVFLVYIVDNIIKSIRTIYIMCILQHWYKLYYILLFYFDLGILTMYIVNIYTI